MKRILVAAALVVLGVGVSPASADLWVSTLGDDTNPGTKAAPFRTIQRTSDLVTPGTTVHVAPGIYEGIINTTRDGTPAKRIRFVSDTKWGATLVPPPGSTTAALWRITGDNVDIDRFHLNGSAAPIMQMGIWFTGKGPAGVGGNNGRARENHVHDFKSKGETGVGGACIDVSAGGYFGTGGEISRNLVHDCGYVGADSWRVQGIYLANKNAKAVNNIVYRNQAFGIISGDPSGNVIANNLVFANRGGIWYSGDAATPYYAVNNIIYGNTVGVDNDAWATDTGVFYLWNNAFFANHKDWDIPVPAGAKGNIYRDPMFVNYQPDGTGNYHLRAASPLVNKGTATKAPVVDYDGKSRPIVRYDVGPYER